MLVKLSRVDVLLLDDFAMAPLRDPERRDILEICILDRLVHNAYRIELNGESIRKKHGRKPSEEETQ